MDGSLPLDPVSPVSPDLDPVNLSKTLLSEQFTGLLNDLEKAYSQNPVVLKDLHSAKEAFTNSENLLEDFQPLIKFKKDIIGVINCSGKHKSKQFNFLKNLELFGLSFRFCHNENKNTKKTIVRYLSNLLSIVELTGTNELNESTIDNLFKGMGLKDGLGGIEKLIENKSIMSLAEKVSKDIQAQNINPMDLMSGLMSGKNILQNKKIANLVTNLSKEIETKIESGELDLKELGIQMDK